MAAPAGLQRWPATRWRGIGQRGPRRREQTSLGVAWQKLTGEELFMEAHIKWRRMLVREVPGDRDGWFTVREGVGRQRGVGGGAGRTEEGSERAGAREVLGEGWQVEKLLMVATVGSQHCSIWGLGGTQGDSPGAGCDGLPTASVAAVVEYMQRQLEATVLCEVGKSEEACHGGDATGIRLVLRCKWAHV
jgi:hypothetical protein